jgi:hypothetical protein
MNFVFTKKPCLLNLPTLGGKDAKIKTKRQEDILCLKEKALKNE